MLSLPDFTTVPVWPIVLLVVMVSALAIFLALMRLRQPLRAVPPSLAGIFAIAMLFSGPSVQAPPKGSQLQDFGGPIAFKTRYDPNRAQCGELIGYCHQRRELLTCPTTYAFMESHEHQPDPTYKIQHANLSDQLRDWKQGHHRGC
jgi:hypothetical protein